MTHHSTQSVSRTAFPTVDETSPDFRSVSSQNCPSNKSRSISKTRRRDSKKGLTISRNEGAILRLPSFKSFIGPAMTMTLLLRPLPSSSDDKMMKRSKALASNGSVLVHRFFVIALFFTLASPSQAQLGTNICSCTPRAYEFTLNFSRTCADTQLSRSGISEYECVVQPFQTGANIDLTPASVETIDFVEFDQSLGRLSESSLFEQYRNGDTITYTATTNEPGSIAIPSVPKALQITMLAQNAIGQPLLMTWLISFTNSCAEYPVLANGNRIGWTEFVSHLKFSHQEAHSLCVCPHSHNLRPSTCHTEGCH